MIFQINELSLKCYQIWLTILKYNATEIMFILKIFQNVLFWKYFEILHFENSGSQKKTLRLNDSKLNFSDAAPSWKCTQPCCQETSCMLGPFCFIVKDYKWTSTTTFPTVVQISKTYFRKHQIYFRLVKWFFDNVNYISGLPSLVQTMSNVYRLIILSLDYVKCISYNEVIFRIYKMYFRIVKWFSDFVN